ncbi:CbtA family protein [Marinobacter sp. 1Y8]
MFRSLIFSACLIGVVLGLTLTAIQSLGVTPILLSAEQFEVAEQPAADHHAAETAESHHHDHGAQSAHHHDEPAAPGHHETVAAPEAGGHHHDENAWSPADGTERMLFTALSNVLAGIGFSAILLVLMNVLRERGYLKPTPLTGLTFGVVGFLAIFVAPSIGLPPEIPGMTAAALESRQYWWLFTVVAAAVGLGLLFLASRWRKLFGLPFLVVPYLWIPAHPAGPRFANTDPAAVSALTELHQQFIWASGLSNLAFWLLAGILCALAVKRLSGKSYGHADASA